MLNIIIYNIEVYFKKIGLKFIKLIFNYFPYEISLISLK